MHDITKSRFLKIKNFLILIQINPGVKTNFRGKLNDKRMRSAKNKAQVPRGRTLKIEETMYAMNFVT